MKNLNIKDLTLDQLCDLEQQIQDYKEEVEKAKDPFGHLPQEWDEELVPFSETSDVVVSTDHYLQFEALRNLLELRDEWREGWEWKPGNRGFAIVKGNGVLYVDRIDYLNRVLILQDRPRAAAFLKAHRELIEAAGDLV